MHAILNRYEGCRHQSHHRADQEGQRDADPAPQQAARFDGYFLIKADNGVITSISLFDTPAHADESARPASTWVRDEKLESA